MCVMLCSHGKGLITPHTQSDQFAVVALLSESLDIVREGSGDVAGFLSVAHYTEPQGRKVTVG